MGRSLSTHGKREVLWKRLKELSDNGKLSMCKSRKEVARMVGYTADREQTGYLWVSGMIRQGKLKETVMGIDNRGYMEYDYKLVEDPVPTKDIRNDWGDARKKGKVNFERLKELAANGKLAQARTRKEVATLVGYGEDEQRTGYSWVSNLITNGHLKETDLYVSPDGKMYGHYALTGTSPSYNYEEQKKRKDRTKAGIPTKENIEEVKIEPVVPTPIKMEIFKGDIIIRIEFDNYKKVGELIKEILKGD